MTRQQVRLRCPFSPPSFPPPCPTQDCPKISQDRAWRERPITVGQLPILAQPASHLALSSASFPLFSCPLSTRYTLHALSGPLSLCDQRQRQLWVFATSTTARSRAKKSHRRSRAYNGRLSCSGRRLACSSPLCLVPELTRLSGLNLVLLHLASSSSSLISTTALAHILSLGLPLPGV